MAACLTPPSLRDIFGSAFRIDPESFRGLTCRRFNPTAHLRRIAKPLFSSHPIALPVPKNLVSQPIRLVSVPIVPVLSCAPRLASAVLSVAGDNAGDERGEAGSGEAGNQERTGSPGAPQLELLGPRSTASGFPSAQRAPAPLSRLPLLDQRSRGTKFIELSVNSVLNTPASTGMGFWSINPYVGCEFGCTYCYARDTHRWAVERAERRYDGKAVNGSGQTLPPYRLSALPPEEAFEKEILVKTEVAAVLARTLNPARIAGHSLVIGTATDPYQPAERRFRLTRRILEVLRSYHGLSISIITKSPLDYSRSRPPAGAIEAQ